MKSVRHHLIVAAYYIKLSVMKQLEYPLYILGTMLMIPLMYLTGILLLYYMVENFHSLAGWSFPQLAFMYGLGYLSHGVMMVFSVQNWWIGTYVLRGEFDRMLLRPLSVFFQFSAMYFNVIGLMDLFVGAAIFFYACDLVHFEWTWLSTINIILVIAASSLLRSAIFTIFCSTAFWTKRSQSMVMLLNEFMDKTTMYPLSIYPHAVQMVLTLVIPIGFISYYPACAILGKSSSIELPVEISIWTLLTSITVHLLSRLVFRLGLKKYESTGS